MENYKNKFIKGTASVTLAALLACSAFLFSACSESNGGSDENAESSKAEAVKISSGENLEINVADITETASFYPVEVDGTDMEIIAIRDSSGEIRTAFNTCQICYASGKGYYKQSGEYLVCQNCGNKFTADQVEVQSGGCNPVPIFDTDKTVSEDTITISYDFLNETKQIFSNWKTTF